MNDSSDSKMIQLHAEDGGEVVVCSPDATLQQVLTGAGVPSLLVDAMQGWTTWHKRNSITMLQVLRTPAASAPFLAALLACGARVSVKGEPQPLEAFLQRSDRGRVDVTDIRIPAGDGRQSGMATVNATPTDMPIVAAFATVTEQDGVVKEARIALTGVWHKAAHLAQAAEALQGSALTPEAIDQAAAAIETEVKPRPTFQGSEAYRRAMAGITVRRALTACVKGA